jgi:diguanylate cyclase (GGDEF)-like protein
MNLREIANKVSKPVWIGLGIALLGGVAYLDYITGLEFSFSLFYLLPISLIAYTVSERFGLVIAFLSAIIWQVVEILSGARYSSLFPYVWNSIIRLGFFFLPVLIIRLNRAIEHEKALARTDFLTGALNTRFFHEMAQMEINRSFRYQRDFTLAFIDVDNFKNINDTFGHSEGDIVLRAIATKIKSHLRKTDIVARVGGDEFVVLLPETDAQTAPIVVSNMQRALLKEMAENGWSITFSIGVLTLTAPQISVDEMLRRADQLMYVVKNGSKNNILYGTHPEKTVAAQLDA